MPQRPIDAGQGQGEHDRPTARNGPRLDQHHARVTPSHRGHRVPGGELAQDRGVDVVRGVALGGAVRLHQRDLRAAEGQACLLGELPGGGELRHPGKAVGLG